MLKLHPDELVRLAPRLRLYLRRPSPAWPEIVDAADWLRHGLDVSKPLWGEACLAMGRDGAGGVTLGDLERPASRFVAEVDAMVVRSDDYMRPMAFAPIMIRKHMDRHVTERAVATARGHGPHSISAEETEGFDLTTAARP